MGEDLAVEVEVEVLRRVLLHLILSAILVQSPRLTKRREGPPPPTAQSHPSTNFRGHICQYGESECRSKLHLFGQIA